MLLALCLATAQSEARPASGERRGEIVLAAGGGISMNQAIAMVEKRYNARVVKADTRQDRKPANADGMMKHGETPQNRDRNG